MNNFRLFALILITLIPASLSAQKEGPGNWLMYFGTNKVTDKLSIHTEVQYRNHTAVLVTIEQLLLRTGLNYHITEKAIVTAGYGYVAGHIFESEQTHPETEEHRLFQQFILKNSVGRFYFEHRYRFEERWVNKIFKTRARYRLMLSIPLNRQKIEKGAFFIGIYDEVFVNLKQTFFDRNRLYGAVGYQFNKSANVQVGMMHQQVNTIGKWNLQFALTWNLDFRKK